MIQQNIAADTLERNQKIFPTSLRLIPAANKPTRISLGAGPADPTAQTGPGSRGFQISVVDRQGKVLNTLGDFIAHRWLSLSPDGNRVLFMTPQPNMHVTDLSTGVKTNLSGTYFNGTPVWSPDGARVAYPRGPGSAGMQLVVRSSDLSGREDLVYSGLAFSSGLYQWSPDGQFILMSLRSGPVALRVTDKKLLPILNGVASAAAFRISPDNRFIAYVSKESGRNPYPEVWVRPFDPSSDNPTSSPQKWQVSNEEAVGMVRWRNDGKELYYVAYRSSTVMAVPISTPEFKAGTPTPLFKLPAGSIQFSDSPGLAADISGDGQRFVFLVPAGARVTNTPTR
jgi:Tol biopolymer transport system component